MEVRKSTVKDIPEIIEIIRQGQTYFKEQGIDQWQNNYPNETVIVSDIEHGNSYVVVEGHQIIGTTVVSFEGESTYEYIYEGKWLTEGEYAVIHRIAVDMQYKSSGVASEMIVTAEKLCYEHSVKSIRVDTHEDNLPMQGLLKKNGFTYCGVIYLEDGAKRIAFEKCL